MRYYFPIGWRRLERRLRPNRELELIEGGLDDNFRAVAKLRFDV